LIRVAVAGFKYIKCMLHKLTTNVIVITTAYINETRIIK